MHVCVTIEEYLRLGLKRARQLVPKLALRLAFALSAPDDEVIWLDSPFGTYKMRTVSVDLRGGVSGPSRSAEFRWAC